MYAVPPKPLLAYDLSSFVYAPYLLLGSAASGTAASAAAAAPPTDDDK